MGIDYITVIAGKENAQMVILIFIGIVVVGAWVRWTLDLDGIRARHKIITGEDL